MAEEGIPYKAETGGAVGSTPDLKAPLGAPTILRPDDFVNLANFNDPTVALKSAYDLTSSLIDNHYKNQIDLAKSQADLSEAAARTNYYGAQSDNIQSESDQRKQLMPLKIQQESQLVQQNKYALDEAKRQADTLDKALSEYGSWNSELSALDPTDPDYDNKVAGINAKYPEASTNPRTQGLITPLLTEHNLKRSQSDVVQQRTDQLNQVKSYVDSGLLPPDTNVRAEVNGGRGQALINQAKSQSVIHRLQTVTAYGDPAERTWAQGQIDAITGRGLGPGETPDRTMFTPTGDLNPGSEALLSTIEQRRGITPAAPGAKKEIKTTVDETTGQPKTETTITGMPVTQSDINAQKPQTPSTVPGAPTTAEDMQKDPTFQGIFSDLATGKLTLPGNAKVGSPEQTAALYAEYARRKAAAAAGKQPAQPSAVPAPTPAPTTGSTSTSSENAASKPEGVADFFRKRGDQPITTDNDPRLTTVNVGDQKWNVNKEAAPYFQGFLSELADAGAPVSSSGGWNYRQKVGARGLSEHAFGGAIDVNQTGRDEVTPQFRKWIAANPGVLQQAERRWHIYGGERFGDLGHFEWGGVPGGTQVAQAQPVPSPAVPQGAREVEPQGGTGALVNSTRNKDGSISTFATNFGHDTEGKPDTYDFAMLGPSARYGAWGDDLFNPQLAGVAIPRETFIAHFGDPNSKENEQLIANRKLAAVVRAPNGQETTLPIVDLGPGAKAKSQAGLDITGAGMRQLGLTDNANVTYRLVRI
jgi:hypothetical protein